MILATQTERFLQSSATLRIANHGKNEVGDSGYSERRHLCFIHSKLLENSTDYDSQPRTAQLE
jgi:hypothetical protein